MRKEILDELNGKTTEKKVEDTPYVSYGMKKKVVDFNKDYDIAIIEILEKDNIKNYLELDDNLFQEKAKAIYEEESISKFST